MLRFSFRILVLLLLLLIAVLMVKTMLFRSKQNNSTRAQEPPAVLTTSLDHFQHIIRFKTISYADTALFDSSQFLGLHRYVESAYPLVHANMQREVINKYSLLYHWKGRNPALKPVIFLAHTDVVPVESLSMWKVEPFTGIIKDGYIWGRGSYDNKVNMVAILETAEKLLQRYFQPERSIYLIFCHDEEVKSPNGARAIAQILKERNIRAELVLDEGGIVTREKLPGVSFPVALIGTAEKGYLTVSLQVKKEGGHSSMPEKETAIDILAKALVELRENPFTPRITLPQEDFIEHLGPELPFFKKMVFANSWLFDGLIIGQYTKTPVGNAVMRTTYAPTIISGGIKENIVPSMAEAVINLRLLPGDSAHLMVERIREIVDDERIAVKMMDHNEATSVTAADGWGFKKVEQAIRKTFDSTMVTPFLLIGGTDSKNFQDISDHIIRFSPLIDPYGNHGIDERVSIQSFRLAMWYYEQLMRGF